VHSLLAQASAVGQIACGLAVAAVARLADLPQALAACTALLTIAIVLADASAPHEPRGFPEVARWLPAPCSRSPAARAGAGPARRRLRYDTARDLSCSRWWCELR
jgi:hypothetical protein